MPIDSDIDRGTEPAPPLPATDVTDAAAPDFIVRSEPAPTQPLPITQVEAMPRRRRGFPWKILLGLLVVAALVTLGLLASRLFATPTYIVPELTEMPRAEALNLIAPNGWEVSQSSERSDEVPVVDQVVRTVPAAGVELAEGEPFLLVVSEGPLLRELPDSTGLPLSEAQTNLLELSLEVETREEFDEVVPDRTVISWSVPGDPTLTAGAMVEPGTPVELVVSKGPAPRVVPDVVGHPVGEARSEVEALQLGFAESGRVFSDDAILGAVISQSIEPGSEVERGSEVSVVVSNGPDLVVFPDISAAATYEEAAAILTPAGFVPHLTFGDAQGAIQSYNIGGESPTVGQTYRRGTQVDFVAL